MNFLEKDLEEIIFNTSREVLREKGLPIFGKIKRQLNLGKYGIADLVTIQTANNSYPWGSSLQITIYELKKDKIGISSFLQALGYAKAIKVYLEEYRNIDDFHIDIVLIGKEIDTTGSFCYIPELFCQDGSGNPLGQIFNVQFYTYKFDINGFSFDEKSGYGLENPFGKLQPKINKYEK
jgi:hypothetical protein